VNDDSRGQWTFTWDTSRTDTSKLQTARYTIKAWNLDTPDVMATISILFKQPEFYIMAHPATAEMGDYIDLRGVAEKGVTYIKLDITDAAGTPAHTFMSPVSATGDFEYGFHVDMKPGQYYVTGTNPSMKNNLRLVLTITAPNSTATATTSPQEEITTAIATPAGTASQTASATQPVPSQKPVSTRTGVAPGTIVLALSVFGAFAIISNRKKVK
jgi:hypothetical protein